MILKLIDHKIRQAFSDAAIQYDVLTSLHKEIGRELIKKMLDTEQNELILDIGMGTGWLTGRLAFYFPESKIIGMDFASGMIDYAKKNNEGFQLVQADAAAIPFKDEHVDIIVSNLAYQWVKNLPQAFANAHSKLKSNGRFSITMFGHDTFQELFKALDESCEPNQKLAIHRLAHKEDIETAMREAGFKDVKVDYEIIKVHFPDMMALVRWIKNIGANVLAKDIFVGKELLLRANEYYNQHYKDRLGIYTTFEVIWVEAQK